MMWRSRLFADSGLLRRRGAALLLALLIEGLLALLLFFLAPPLPKPKEENRTTVFGIEAPRDGEGAKSKPVEKQRKKTVRAEAEQPRTQPPPPVPQPIETPVPVGPPSFLKLSRNDYQRGDIASVPSRGPMRSADTEVADNGPRDDDSPVVGRAPNGEPMYAPGGWVRKPTQAELGPYRSPNSPRKGVGKIACRTAPGFRLEDCQIIGESPAGSGFGYALLQASWQFRMRPPRLGGKDLIGRWVIIICDYDTIQR